MNRAEFLAFHKDFCDRMHDICQRKNADYAGPGGDDAFANFSRVEGMGIATTIQGFLTRMNDKMSRLSSFAQAGSLQVKDESAEDTLLDLANYSALLAGFLRSQRLQKERGNTVERVLSMLISGGLGADPLDSEERKAVEAYLRERGWYDVYGQEKP